MAASADGNPHPGPSMTLGIGYQGRDFALLLTDSMNFAGGSAMTPQPNGNKLHTQGDRIVYVVSGKLPEKNPPDVSQFIAIQAARQLRDCWLGPVNRPYADPETGIAFHLLIAGGPKGQLPSLCEVERPGPPCTATLGDLFVIGCEAELARDRGIERNYGELSEAEAIQCVSNAADALTDNMYAELGCPGCRSVEEFTERLGYFPAIGRPFRLAVIDQNNPIKITEL